MMANNKKLIEKDLSFEEFEEMARNIPKRYEKTIFCLEEIDIIDEQDEIEYPEINIYRHIMGLLKINL